jgi:hypothetical protein
MRLLQFALNPAKRVAVEGFVAMTVYLMSIDFSDSKRHPSFHQEMLHDRAKGKHWEKGQRANDQYDADQ